MQTTNRKNWNRLTKSLVLLAFILYAGKLVMAGTMEVGAKANESNMLGHEATIAKMAALPASFIANHGQVSDATVRYILQGKSTTIYLTDDSLVFRMSSGKNIQTGNVNQKVAKTGVFKMTLAGAEKTTAQAAEKLPGVANYFIGQDRNKWHTSIPTYAQVQYKNVYPGIDMAVWGSRKNLKYEFQLAPGTNADTIQIDYSGIEGLSLDDKGNLHITTAAGKVIDYAPFAYQKINGQRVEVKVSYKLIDNDSYGFLITGDYDESLPLTIDPDLAWSTFLGGSAEDYGRGIAIDSSGNVYVTGLTKDAVTDFPKTTGAYDESHNGNYDVFVSKLNSSGSSLTYSTFIGGSGEDVGYAIDVDGSGNAYVTGECDSGFPTTNGAYDTSHNGGLADVFVVKLNNTGNSLSYSTYIGDGDDDRGYGIAVDGSGDIWLTGKTVSTNFPTTNGAYDMTHNGNADVFVVKLSPDSSGSSDLLYSTYIGGSGGDYGNAILEDNGDAFVTGYTFDAATDFPTTNNAYDTTHNGAEDAFVVRISPDGSGSSDLVYSTFLGGSETDKGHGIAIDSSDNLYIVGETEDGTTDFPTTSGAYNESHNGEEDVFVAKISPDANGSGDLIYSTFIGGNAYDYGYAIAVSGENAFVTGKTYDYTTDYPTTSGAYDESHNGGYDVFVSELTKDGSDLYYSTFIGGSSHDYGYAIAVDSSGNVYVTGETDDGTTDFPTTSGAYDESHNGNYDVFVSKLTIGRERLPGEDFEPGVNDPNWDNPNEYDGTMSFAVLDADRKVEFEVIKYVLVNHGFISTHCKTASNICLEHYHFESDITAVKANRFWNWYYDDVPSVSYSDTSTNGKDSIAHAMHGYKTGAVYNYWLVHGSGNNQANKAFTEDCSTITSSNVRANDRLAYDDEGNDTGDEVDPSCSWDDDNIYDQVTVVTSATDYGCSNYRPTDISWKCAYSRIYSFDNSGQSNQFATSDMKDLSLTQGSSPTGTYDSGYFWGGPDVYRKN